MICAGCQTTLPDEAVACWKCGTPTGRGATASPVARPSTPPNIAPSSVLPVHTLPQPAGSPPAATAAEERSAHDLLLLIVTFVGNAVFFVCAGWAVPFAIWGNIVSTGKQNPEWASAIELGSGVALVISGLVFFLACWLGSYWVIMRLINPNAGAANKPAAPVVSPASDTQNVSGAQSLTPKSN